MALDIQICKIIKIKSTDKSDLYSASIKMTNNTDKVFRFWIMTCSWQDSWIVNDKSFWLLGEPNCDSNFPDLIELKPNQSVSYECRFGKNKNVRISNKEGCKVGFVFVGEKENSHMDNVFQEVVEDKIARRKDVIWSQSFNLN
jgi:hypothetical protein